MIKIKKALLSVSDKTGIVELARELVKLKVSILSTGGTAALLKESKIPCTGVSDYTGFPEMMGGRVKTLHPKIHGGILARRQEKKDKAELKKYGIEKIDLVVVNLYLFEETVKKGYRVQGTEYRGQGARKEKTLFQEAIEQIDIGGVTLLRSAAKNHQDVVVVAHPVQYDDLIVELKRNKGAVSEETAQRWAVGAFMETASYDRAIAQYLASRGEACLAPTDLFPQHIAFSATKVQDLRYGENPHQKGAWYRDVGAAGGHSPLPKQLHGKELSFNNLLDLDAALALVSEFNKPTVAIIKHASPCGVAQAPRLESAFRQAFESNPLSAFGGIVGLNCPVDEKTAKAILASGFLECLIAPGYSEKGLHLLKQKKNLRVLQSLLIPSSNKKGSLDVKRIHGGFLVQEWDTAEENPRKWKVVTQKKPTQEQIQSALFGWKVAKCTRSNAIVLCQGTKTIGLCGGQAARVEAVRIAVQKAGERTRGSVLASDAFLPMADNIVVAAAAGISCIVQPGGSIRDPEIISAADKAGIAMIFTGVRHFRH